MDQLDRRAYLEEKMQSVSIRCQLVFAAAVAERLLPTAKAALDAWRSVAWPAHRNALNEIWNFLEGKGLSDSEYSEIREACVEQLPHDEDPNWPGGYGGFEAGAAVAYALEVLIDSNSIDAVRAGNQPFNAMREYLIDSMFPDARTHRDLDEDEISNSELFKREIEMQDRHLSLLIASNSSDNEFAATLNEIKTESLENPIVL